MIVAIMQPYFFPYIGYFQLMHAADTFVVYDDVQYMKGGWINRNRIRLDDKATWLTIPVHRASTYLDINQREYQLDESTLDRVTNKLSAAYSSAPAFAETLELVKRKLACPNPNVAAVNTGLLQATAERIGISCQLVMSSVLGVSRALRGEDRVIAVCKALQATAYVNAIGGIELYDPDHFAMAGMRLSFLRTLVPPEPLSDGPVHLSILDTLFRESPAQIAGKLDCCELVPG
jgi:WbqC-like protein family